MTLTISELELASVLANSINENTRFLFEGITFFDGSNEIRIQVRLKPS